MSNFGDAHVDVTLDSKQAEKLLRDLLARIAQQQAKVVVAVDARDVVPTIESAVDAANTHIQVTGEATEVTGAVEGAVDAADTEATVTGDARQVTSAVDGAVDAADTQVVVTGEAGEVTGAIDGAVQAADTHVELTADSEQLAQAGSDAEGVVAALAEAAIVGGAVEESFDGAGAAAGGLTEGITGAAVASRSLGGVIKAIGIAAIGKQIFDAAQAASDLAESQSKAEQVFRSSIGVVNDFGEESATSVGLSERAALDAAGTFGNLFTSLGLARGEAAKLSPEVIRLSTDFASFNNLNLDETLDAVRAGLIGEIEPLRRLGVSFNAAQVEAKALELGLADTKAEITEGAKVQARWALIQEQAKNVTGDFARTSEGLANQQRILRAEFENAVTEIGQGFLPVLLELVRTGRTDLIPVMVDLAKALGPALADSISALIPLLGGTTDLLVALTPIINVLAAGLQAVPPELIATVGGFVALNRIAGFLGPSLGKVKAGLDLSAFLTPTNIALGVGAVALALWSQRQERARAESEALEQQTDRLGTAFEHARGPIEGIIEQLGEMVRAGDEIEFRSFEGGLKGVSNETIKASEALRDVGLTTTGFARILEREGVPGVEELIRKLTKQGNVSNDALNALTELAEGYEKEAQAAIQAGIATGEWTRRQAESAIAATDSADGSNIYVAALEKLRTEQIASEEAATEQAEALEASNQALTDLTRSAPGVADALSAFSDGSGSLVDRLTAVALAVDEARLSGEELDTVAAELNVTAQELAPALDELLAPIQDLKDETSDAVPGLDDIASQIKDLESISVPKLRRVLSDMLEDTRTFNDNMALIIQEAPLLSNLAAQSPEIAATIAGALRDGKDGAIAELELLVAGIGQEMIAGEQAIDDGAPGLIGAMSDAGLLSTEALRDAFLPSKPASERLIEARASIRAQRDSLHNAGEFAGAGAASGFGSGTSSIPGTASERLGTARQRIREQRDPMHSAGSFAGSGASSGFASGTSNLTGIASSRFAAARQRIREQKDAMHGAGQFAGSGSREGFVAGLEIPRRSINPVISRIKTNVTEATKEFFGIHSPARVMIPLGRRVSEGLITGIMSNQSWVNRMLRSFGQGVQAQILANLGLSKAFGGGGGRGVEQWRQTALAALRYTSQDASWVNDLLTQMAHESGGNPRAINNWDINAQRGDPSRGLMQTIGSTFRAFARELVGRGIYDPFANIVAAIRYTLSRYGDLGAWRRRGFQGYEEGAWKVPREGGFTHFDEMVLPAQIARVVRSEVSSPSTPGIGAGMNIQNLTIVVPAGTNDPFAFGRNVRRGFAPGVVEQKIRVDARVAR